MTNLNSDAEKKRTAELWAEYKRNPTKSLQTELANKYTPLVHKIAKGFAYKKPSVLDYDDLIQSGKLGLLDAIEKFDPDNAKKAQFQTYATFRIRGAIIDEINAMDWTPRSVRQNIKGVLKSIENHYTTNQQDPTVKEIAKQADLPEDETRQILRQMDKTFIIQVENEILDIAGPTTNQEQEELSSMINIVLNTVLNEVERAYIVLKFYMGYTNKEIQATLNLKNSEMKQVRDSSTLKLTEELESPSERYNN